MKDWDRELDILASDLASLTAGTVGSSSRESLQSQKVRIVQVQVNISRKIERIRRVLTRDLLLLPREQALLHWAGVFCDIVRGWLPKASELNARKLWLHLIKIRMGSTDSDKLLPDDLVELATRQAELKKTETLLTESIIDLDAKRKELHTRYGHLDITQANAEASGSLQARLGSDYKDACASPLFRALSDFFFSLAKPSGQDEANRRLDQMERRTSSLMNMARHMINGLTRGRHVPSKSKRKFQHMLTQLSDMESETRAALIPDVPKSQLNTANQSVQNP